jgi:hypothetical protein
MDRLDIIDAIEVGLDDMLADAPEYLSEAGRNEIKEEYAGYARRVVDSLSKDELASESAFERFVQTTLAEARMQMRMRRR